MYSGTLLKQKFFMHELTFPLAHTALVDWAKHYAEELGPCAQDRVEADEIIHSKDLMGALSALGMDPLVSEKRMRCGIYALNQHRHDCCGQDHEDAWRSIAGFVKPGSYLIFHGENDDIFRYRLITRKC